ncbi:6-phosphogluconolactonase [Niastella koreensis]|uniref:6-phosphogluconolactonase n=2 Tax=Niastella koreensis TaxID=354356 RepID=G8TG88_NIAKG|nr:6-phosphogluconolactonase [Niastella koreensis]AEW02727.1 6-phosphogluconolactonase [Niastella koreensis GR20-10]OQP55070.1 6-phosphogluconolactonase [Niastella koreensis]
MLHIYKTPEEVSHALAEWITTNIETTLQKQDRFTWVVTGGNSPKLLYDLLAAAPYRDRIDWSKMHIFWGDERAVPFDDSRNNAKMTYEHLLNKVPVVASQVHVMDTTLSAEESAKAYEAILHQYFGNEGPSFDLVLNGMGDDGHTLSLFPHTPVIHEQKAWVTSFYLDAQQMYRITLTAPIVNRARKVAFLTFGAGKANALFEVLKGEPAIEQYPSQIIQPASGQLHWFVDEAAASKVKG